MTTPPRNPPSRATVAGFFVAPLVAALTSHAAAACRPGIYAVTNPFPTFETDLAAALEVAFPTGRMKVYAWKELQRRGGSAAAEHLRESQEVAAELERDIVDAVNAGADVLLLCESSRALSTGLQGLVDRCFSIPRLTANRLGEACRTFYGVGAPSQKSSAYWIGLVTPRDFLTTSHAGASAVAQQLKRSVDQRLALSRGAAGAALTQLHGMGDAGCWARGVVKAIKGALAGRRSWTEVDRGALFVGPPGIGKTALAKAIATTSGLKFIRVSCSRLKGRGASDDNLRSIRAAFAEARASAPAILLVDEVDALGRRDGTGGGNASDLQMIDLLCDELDGLAADERVVFVGAASQLRGVDASLRRAGRLDLTIPVELPTARALAQMFRVHVGRLGQSLPTADFQALGRMAVGLTGGDVEVHVRNAWRRASQTGRESLRRADIEEQIFRTPGDGNRRALSQWEIRNTAYHEAGHCVLRLLCAPKSEEITYVSIVPRVDGPIGFVAAAWDESRASYTRAECFDRVRVLLAGRAAEEVLAGGADGVSNGAGGGRSSDLARATRMLERMFGKYGFGQNGSLVWRETANVENDRECREEVERILGRLYGEVKETLAAERILLDSIATTLIRDQEVAGERIYEIFRAIRAAPRRRQGAPARKRKLTRTRK